MKNVALFGGSFDPVHSKHVSIAYDLLDSFDEVWVIVAKSSPFKNKHFVSFEDRFKMCEIAFNNERVKVLDVEEKQNLKYTYDVVKYLTDLYDYNFSFVIGGDNLASLEKWYKYEELKNLVEFVTFERTEISSTIVRVSKDTQIPEINNYIKDNNLYINNYEGHFLKLKDVVDQKRFNHTIYVYSLINELATVHNLDVEKCSLAAIYHDYYKSIANKNYIEEFKINYPQYKNFSNSVMHAIIAGELLDLDEEVLEAIKYHTLGKEGATSILKALYVADYVERSRTYFNEVKYILEMALKDLDKAYEEAFNKRRKKSIEKYGVNEDMENFIKNKEII